MASSTTAVLVRYDDPVELGERAAVAGFLAGYTGDTLTSYTTDLRLFATWCAERGVRLLGVEGVLRRNPAANVRRPRVDHESRTSGWTATSSAPSSCRRGSARPAITR